MRKIKSVKYWFNADPDEVHRFTDFNERRLYTKTGVQRLKWAKYKAGFESRNFRWYFKIEVSLYE